MSKKEQIDSLDAVPPKKEANAKASKLLMGLLCYLIPFIPFFFIKDDEFIQFHAAQGMELLIVAFAANILMAILGMLIPWQLDMVEKIMWFAGEIIIGLLVFVGLINVLTRKTKTLPIIGNLKIID